MSNLGDFLMGLVQRGRQKDVDAAMLESIASTNGPMTSAGASVDGSQGGGGFNPMVGGSRRAEAMAERIADHRRRRCAGRRRRRYGSWCRRMRRGRRICTRG
jgi:hypothetical protein